jgi:hypothetical protein
MTSIALPSQYIAYPTNLHGSHKVKPNGIGETRTQPGNLIINLNNGLLSAFRHSRGLFRAAIGPRAVSFGRQSEL